MGLCAGRHGMPKHTDQRKTNTYTCVAGTTPSRSYGSWSGAGLCIQSGAAASASSIFSVVEATSSLRGPLATLAPLSFFTSRGAQTSPCDAVTRAALKMGHILGDSQPRTRRTNATLTVLATLVHVR